MFTIEETTRPFKVLIYGLSGVGKTTLASKIPNAALIDCENGSPHIKMPKKKVSTYLEFFEALEGASKSNFDTIIIDSLTYLEKWIFAKVAKDAGKKNIIDIAFYKGFEIALTEWELIMTKIYQLNKTKNIICIAHAQVTHLSDPELGEYDELSPALHKKAGNIICSDFDGIFCIRPQIIVNDEKAVRTNNTFVYTQPSNGIMAKSRFNLPNKIALKDFDWSKIVFNY